MNFLYFLFVLNNFIAQHRFLCPSLVFKIQLRSSLCNLWFFLFLFIIYYTRILFLRYETKMQSATASQISFELSKSLGAHNSCNGSVSNGGSSSFRDLPTPRAPDITAASHTSPTETSHIIEWSEVLPRVSPAEQTRRGSLRSPPTQDIGPSLQTTRAEITGGAGNSVLPTATRDAHNSSLDNLHSSPELQLQLSNALSPEQQLQLLQRPPSTSPALEELKSRHRQLSRLVFPESSRQGNCPLLFYAYYS